MKNYKIVSTENAFPVTLKKIRLNKNLSRSEFGNLINKNKQQIQRYETIGIKGVQQFPPLDAFVNMCITLQVDANELLGLKWVECEKREQIDSVVYDWTLKGDAVYWSCPVCHRENITYNDFSKNKNLIKKQSAQCEYTDCYAFFDKFFTKV